jgi:hypothetical protein
VQRSRCHLDKKRAKSINGPGLATGRAVKAVCIRRLPVRFKRSEILGYLSAEVAGELPRAHRIDLGHRLFHA